MHCVSSTNFIIKFVDFAAAMSCSDKALDKTLDEKFFETCEQNLHIIDLLQASAHFSASLKVSPRDTDPTTFDGIVWPQVY